MALSPAIFLDNDGTLVHDLPCNVVPACASLTEAAAGILARDARAAQLHDLSERLAP